MADQPRTTLEKIGTALQIIGICLFFVPFAFVPLAISCGIESANTGGVDGAKMAANGARSMCIGFGGFFLLFIGSILSPKRRRNDGAAEPPAEQPAAPPAMTKPQRCPGCGAPPNRGEGCAYCGTPY